MASRKQTPIHQRGRHDVTVSLSADKTESGEEETGTLTFEWRVLKCKPMTARAWTKWEIECARNHLERAARGLRNKNRLGAVNIQNLELALLHAITAWCRTHLRGKGGAFSADVEAFMEKAPSSLQRIERVARVAKRAFKQGTGSPEEAVALTQIAVEALLDAASNPPKSRRRYPARLVVPSRLSRPRVRPGGWIDTGRYRPAQVLSVAVDPPHMMSITYGDEIVEDSRPHVSDWKTVRRPRKLVSLSEVFAPGDWVRSHRLGYGRVLSVSNTRLEVKFKVGSRTLTPSPKLEGLEKVSSPPAEDTRVDAERYLPGTWIERAGMGPVVVVQFEENLLKVFRDDRLWEIVISDEPVIWVLDRPKMDMSIPRVRRHLWCLSHGRGLSGGKPCPCCGYVNLGVADEFGVEPVQCIICGWTDDGRGDDDADEVTAEPDPNDPLDWNWPNVGYSLSQARQNFEATGLMFREGDEGRVRFIEALTARSSIRRILNESFEQARCPTNSEWRAILDLRAEVMFEWAN